MAGFVHLHVHTQYSVLDGAASIKKLFEKAKENEQKALAITDHGNMFGVMAFLETAKKSFPEIKPIVGCEFYVAKGSRFERKGREDQSSFHLILLAKNYDGYKNLVKLTSDAYIEGYHYKPRIDRDLIAQYSSNLICSSACLAGEVARAISAGDMALAEENALWYKGVFGDDYYLELQRHETYFEGADTTVFAAQTIVNEGLLKIAAKHGIKCIATNDVHFVSAEDREAHDRLICLTTNSDYDDPKRLRYTKQEYLKSEAEMYEIFKDIPVVLDNTLEIADKIEVYSIESKPIMPNFPIPQEFEDANIYLRELTYRGATIRYDEITKELSDRIDFELATIRNMGYPDYFLIVQDFIAAARSMNVSVGPGRGSAAGSVVAYCLRITDIDPLKYDLLFERFLNPDRISLPDIDIDFDDDGRSKVLQYVEDKYGKDHVSHVATFGSMAAKSAIRDVARIQKVSLQESGRLAKLVPTKFGVEEDGKPVEVTIENCIKYIPEMGEAYNVGDPLIRMTLDFAGKLEGTVRNVGVHACAIIIGRDDLRNHIPISTANDKETGEKIWVSQYEGSQIEKVGMLKMDFLGLRTLSIIKDAIANIRKSKGIEIDIDSISMTDEPTFQLFSRGDTVGTFQFESDGMRKWLRELKPSRFEDLIAMNALYRPGPMDYIPDFVSRKHGLKQIEYDLPVMEEILSPTYGITVYQEQVMLLSQRLANFTKGDADVLRKAMGKKDKKTLDGLKSQFMKGGEESGHPKDTLEKIWKDWEAFAQYAFNKSHSTCYAWIGYQTAYLKANYSAEYMAAALSRNLGDIDELTKLMDESKRIGIAVLGPDVNESNIKFTVNKDGNIRFGLGAIKGIGEAASLQLIAEREKNGFFNSIYDLVERVSLNSLNKKSLEAMALAGAFDYFSQIPRSQYFSSDAKGVSFVESLIRYGNSAKEVKNSSQNSLWGETGGFDIVKPEPTQCQDWPKLETLNKEKEVIGIYLSAHPLDDFKFEINAFTTASLADIQNLKEHFDKDVVVAGMVTDIREGTSKNGKPYGSFTIQDYSDSFRFMLFDKDYVENRKFCVVGYYLLVSGKVQKRKFGDELEFKIKKIMLLSSVKDELVKSVTIKIDPAIINNSFVMALKEIIDENKGATELKFQFVSIENKISLPMFSRTCRVRMNNELISFLDDFPGIEYTVK